jgi:hypothetical protein
MRIKVQTFSRNTGLDIFFPMGHSGNMKKNTFTYKSLISLLGLSFIFLSLIGCGKKTEEDILLENVAQIGKLAEDRNLTEVLSYISPNYLDDEERTASDIADIIDQYLERYRGIAINLLATKIKTLTLPNAEIETEVSLSSGAAKFLRKAMNYAGAFYRFNVKLVKTGEKWHVVSASWYPISLHELFPESAKIFKDLF